MEKPCQLLKMQKQKRQSTGYAWLQKSDYSFTIRQYTGYAWLQNLVILLTIQQKNKKKN